MPEYPFGDRTPRIDPTAFVAAGARIVGYYDFVVREGLRQDTPQRLSEEVYACVNRDNHGHQRRAGGMNGQDASLTSTAPTATWLG